MAVYQSLTLSQISQNIQDNTSQVRILWESTQTGASHNDNSRTAYYNVYINGGQATQYSVSYTLPQGTTKTIVDTTITVPHKNDGTGTITVNTWMDTRISAGVVEKSQTLTLSTIPRATTPVIAPLVMGQEGTIKLDPASNNFTHTITYNFGIRYFGTIATKTAERSIKWTPPKSLANVLTSAEAGKIHFRCTTYNGDTLIGSTDVGTKITVSPDTVPTVSVSLSDAAGYKNTYGWVQNKSRLKASITAAGVMGSKIIDTVMTVNGKVVNAGAENNLPDSGSIPVKVVVTDSRKRTATYSTNLSVSAYTTPVINNLAYVRGSYTESVWTENPSGADIKITFTLAMALSANRANLTVSLDGVAKQTITNQSAGAKTLYLPGVGTDTTRKLEVAISDAFGSKTSKEIIVATVEVPLNINFSLPAVCFGGIAEKEKTVQFKWPVDLNGDLTIVGNLKLNGVSIQDILSKLSTDYITEQGTTGVWTWRKWASGTAELWGVFSADSLAVNNAWGSVYYGTWMHLTVNKNGREYPFVFTDTPVVIATPYSPSTDFWLLTDSTNNVGTPQTHAPAYACVLPASGTITGPQIHYHVIGKYK
ncbi:DUF859 family phage minor structural protein [Leyella stercorea]|uniref:DUF859 family phage minor structural protein n=1 Tax=Leyella stercorea TaxID=363265 RepID=UPI00242AD64F|nr:DUF859 family phage minor structural protein [Leyella stercorea]